MITWVDLKRKLADADGSAINIRVDRIMQDLPEKVTYKTSEKADFYELQECEGEFEVFYRVHKLRQPPKITVEIMAFDNKLGAAYYRKISDVF
ncbi:MAG: hypothetical protein FMNOHCHN_03842 [Ignavibacteriaceae bacterium]|nr:hypothetical protein [Ignavibacteriaceae bacterium]